MKTVYIAHPLRGNFDENMKKVEKICQELAQKAEVVPFSPLHAFSFFDPSGDQALVMKYCYALLTNCNELWLYGEWQKSEGCRMEYDLACQLGIPIKFMEAQP